MHRVVAGALGRGFGEGDEAGRASIAGGQFAQAAEFRTVGQPQPRHCFVRALRRLNLHFAGRRTPRRILEFRLDALGTERTDDVNRPIRRRLEAALDIEGSFDGVVGQFHDQILHRFRHDERLADFEFLDGERPPLEQFAARLQCHFDEPGRGKDNVFIHAMVAQIGEVALVETTSPRGHGAE